jgi:hypothetical protein
LRLIAVALLDLPETIILPGQHMVRIGLQCAFVPDLRKPVIADPCRGSCGTLFKIALSSRPIASGALDLPPCG